VARYNKFAYGAQKYGASTPENVIWGLVIDWDDDEVFNGINEASRLKGVSIRRGRNFLITSSGDRFEPIDPGKMTVTLDNSDRRYDPYNEASPLYPNVDSGRFIKLMVRVGATVYDLFSGIVQNIEPDNNLVYITAEDGHGWLLGQNVISGVYRDTTADAAIGAVLEQAKWPALWGQSIQVGVDPLDYWWMRGRNAMEEIRSLADSEFGRVFINASGQLVFYNRIANRPVVAEVDQSEILRNIAIPQPWEVRRNIIEVQSNPIAELAQTDIWTASTEYVLSPGASIEIFVNFDSPAINVLQPASTTDYTAFSQSNGLGDDLTANISVVAVIYGETALLTITNSGAELAYINLLKMRGKPLFSSSVKSRATGTGYDRRPRMLTLDLEWQQDINNPASFASEMLQFLGGAREMPVIQVEGRPELQFAADLFDPITLQIPAREISDTFQIGSIEHEWISENGQAVRTTWRLEPYKEYAYWRFPVTFDTTSILG
jgi:hypothetical protein